MRCRICDNEKDNRDYHVQEMMFGYKDVFEYFQCSKCNCLQIKEFPSDMSKYYPNEYHSYQPFSKPTNRVKKFLVNLRNKYAVFNKGLIGKLLYKKYPNAALRSLSSLPINGVSQILDVGCGVGHLLYHLHELGFKNLRGVDPYNEKDIEYDGGLCIQKKNIHDVQGKWDLIMFHHSFEHVPDPIDTLQSAFGLLAPGGYCVIRIPIVSSHAWEHYGVHWVQLDAPRHFYLHSIESMEMLSNKIGFELCNIIYDSTAFQFWGSEQYIKDIPLKDDRSYGINPDNSIFSEKDIALFASSADDLNSVKRGDQAIFYLRKTNKI